MVGSRDTAAHFILLFSCLWACQLQEAGIKQTVLLCCLQAWMGVQLLPHACQQPQEVGIMCRTLAEKADAAHAQAEPHVKVRLASSWAAGAAYVLFRQALRLLYLSAVSPPLPHCEAWVLPA